MIDKVEFTSKNLTSNVGVLLLPNYTEEQRIFQELDEILVFDNESAEEIKMNHLKTLICGDFVGADKLERFLLLKAEQVVNGEGNQEGAVKGCNLDHKGNNCYHLLMAFYDELKAYIAGSIRSENTYTSNGAAEMIKEIIANLRDEVDNIVF